MNNPKGVVRLTEEMLMALEKRLTPPMVTTTTTELLAGFTLGQQSVLKMLRDGYTIGT
jgi:hypothetical protein